MKEKKHCEIPELEDFVAGILDILDDLPDAGADVDLCEIVTPANIAILAELLDDLAEFIEDTFIPDSEDINEDTNFGFLAQIQRLVCIIELLADRLVLITCPDNPSGLAILRELLCVLVEALAILVGIIIKLIVLESFLSDYDDFFECLACNLVKEITALEEAVKDISKLVLSLISNNLDNDCTPCFVASNSSKKCK